MGVFFESSFLENKLNIHSQSIIIILILSGFSAFGYWAYETEISEVQVSKGKIRHLERIHTVQHDEPATVEKIFVKEGDVVSKGDRLLAFRSEQIQSSLKKLNIDLATLQAQKKFFDEKYEANIQLYKEGVRSKQSMDSMELEKIRLKGSIESIKETIRHMMFNSRQTELIAPISGKVLEINVTGNTVVQPSEPIMKIVPENQDLEAEIQISPASIGHIAVGQDVTIKISAYDFNLYGSISGKVENISPFTLTNEEGEAYFRGIVGFEKNGLDRDPEKYKVLPGMTLTAEIKTGRKSLFDYMLKPLYDSTQSAFRER